MKVLIVPMAAMAETAGSFSRAMIIAEAMADKGIDAALCAAKDVNYRDTGNIPDYRLAVPSPMGLPKLIASRTFPIAQKLGITAKKPVRSFEEVLFLTGNISYRYLKTAVGDIQNAIDTYKPDVIYSEFSIQAIIAALKNGVKLCATVSVPTQSGYASSPQFTRGVNRLLREYGLPEVRSTLELFDRADMRFVPSVSQLERFADDSVIYCGSLRRAEPYFSRKRNKLLVYMGNGTISTRKTVRETEKAFAGGEYEVYIAAKSLKTCNSGNIHTAPRFDFGRLLPETAVYINHGGQNSIVDGLIYGVPQIVCPGKVFERIFNAQSLSDNGAGIVLPTESFNAAALSAAVGKLVNEPSFGQNAQRLSKELLGKGGAETVAETILSL